MPFRKLTMTHKVALFGVVLTAAVTLIGGYVFRSSSTLTNNLTQTQGGSNNIQVGAGTVVNLPRPRSALTSEIIDKLCPIGTVACVAESNQIDLKIRSCGSPRSLTSVESTNVSSTIDHTADCPPKP